jgi:hypothetical protein
MFAERFMSVSRAHAAALRGAPPRSIVVAPGHCRSIATTSLRAAAPPPALGAGRALRGCRPAVRTTCAAALRPTGSNADEPSQPRDAAWDTRFEELKAYAATHGGSTNVPQVWPANQPLADWVRRQRLQRATVPADHKAKLDALSFVWQPAAAVWDGHYEQAKAYAETHGGSTEVPKGWAPDPELADWLKTQRQLAADDMLAPEHAAKLAALSYAWSNSDAAFAHGLQQLAAYSAAHDGSTAVPDGAAWPGAAPLREWLHMQRLCKKDDTLNPQRIAQLEKLGFVWEENDAIWQHWLRQLKAYAAARQGSTNVPHAWPENTQLADWVSRQRKSCFKDKLGPEREAMLTALSYAWGNSDADFAHGLQQLEAYAAAHDGSTVVPAQADGAAWPGAAPLREWLHMQRLRKTHGTLSSKRVRQLEQLGLIWEESDAIWQDWLRQLKAYAASHDGSTRVPDTGSKLGSWVARQREYYAKNTLAPERIAQLDALGFTWKCT